MKKTGKGGVKAWAKQFDEHLTFNLNVLQEDDIKPQAPPNPYDAVCVLVCVIVRESDVGCVPFARANTVRALCLVALRWTWE